MLVLSRKLGQRIVVPDCELEITVLAIDSQRIRLGISAPAGLGVYRQELWTRMQADAEPQACGGEPVSAQAAGECG